MKKHLKFDNQTQNGSLHTAMFWCSKFNFVQISYQTIAK